MCSREERTEESKCCGRVNTWKAMPNEITRLIELSMLRILMIRCGSREQRRFVFDIIEINMPRACRYLSLAAKIALDQTLENCPQVCLYMALHLQGLPNCLGGNKPWHKRFNECKQTVGRNGLDEQIFVYKKLPLTLQRERLWHHENLEETQKAVNRTWCRR